MNNKRIILRSAVAFALVAGLNLAPSGIGLTPEADAVVGAPLSPVSYAGVARRTAYRGAAAASTTAAASSASQQQAATASQQAAVAEQQAATATQQAAIAQQQAAAAQQQAAAAKLPVGTTVSALPAGCTSAKISGVDYFNCGGVYYKPAYQSNNIVYVVSQP
jgi:multidrug efflux pump subunit AcrA (membrane-fusion protein)